MSTRLAWSASGRGPDERHSTGHDAEERRWSRGAGAPSVIFCHDGAMGIGEEDGAAIRAAGRWALRWGLTPGSFRAAVVGTTKGEGRFVEATFRGRLRRLVACSTPARA